MYWIPYVVYSAVISPCSQVSDFVGKSRAQNLKTWTKWANITGSTVFLRDLILRANEQEWHPFFYTLSSLHYFLHLPLFTSSIDRVRRTPGDGGRMTIKCGVSPRPPTRTIQWQRCNPAADNFSIQPLHFHIHNCCPCPSASNKDLLPPQLLKLVDVHQPAEDYDCQLRHIWCHLRFLSLCCFLENCAVPCWNLL